MKAIRVHEFGGPEVLKLEELPDPKPGPGDVVVRIRAIGVNPVDTYVRSGKYRTLPALPYTPGADAAGVVESVGAEVTRFEPGDRVYIGGTVAGNSFGAYATHALSKQSQVHPLHDNVTFEQGAAVSVA